MRGLVSDIQRYSTKDGPGIRTTVFLVGCTLRCAWCANPECIRHDQQVMHFRMRCRRCGACARVDPSIVIDGDGAHAERSKLKRECMKVCSYDAFELNGSWMESDTVVANLLRDRDYFEMSGGGVTIGGGEPLAQPEFVLDVLRKLKGAGLATCIDTCGNVSLDVLQSAQPYCDLMLYDIKAVDSDIHRRGTGSGNEQTLANLAWLDSVGQPLWIRMPVIGGYNDQSDDLARRFDLVAGLTCVKRVDVLPYHEYGVGKYQALGWDYPLGGEASVSTEKIALIRELAQAHGVAINVAEE